MLQYNSYGDENREDGNDNNPSREPSPTNMSSNGTGTGGIMKDTSNQEEQAQHRIHPKQRAVKTVRVQSPVMEGMEGGVDGVESPKSVRKSRIF